MGLKIREFSNFLFFLFHEYDIHMEIHKVFLKDDSGHAVEVWFYGYSIERIQNYLLKRYSSSGRWTSFKIVE